MREMTTEEIEKYAANPNIMLKIAGKPLRCKCGCNVFQHPGTDADVYKCNACEWTFEAE